MSVLINKQKDEVILTCKCGCDDAVHIKVIHDDWGVCVSDIYEW